MKARLAFVCAAGFACALGALAGQAQPADADAAMTDAAEAGAVAEAEAADDSDSTVDTTDGADDADDEGAELTPRGRYNRGLTHLDGAAHDAAAEDFLAARDSAGPDPELRYRAAFNLGLALAHGVAEEAPPAEAIDTLRQSAAWFNDAVRLAPPGDDDARVNLELVSRRILALADQLNEGATLEGRIDRLIDDQRSVRDGIRGLLADVAVQEAGSEPHGFQDGFRGLASRERMLLADVGESIDLATEERLFIEQTPPEQLTPEQQGRAYQLQGVADFLERARQSLSDARRRLRRLEGERAHRRADAALAELKRAREQLLDPLRTLQAAARDEAQLNVETVALANYRAQPLGEPPPAWLTTKHLADRQEDVGARTGGVLGRFEAVLAADNGEADELRPVAEATPLLERGLAAMRSAIRALESDDPGTAAPEQTHALEQLGRAIELFAGAKELIELAYAGQLRLVALLTPDSTPEAETRNVAERTEAVFAATSGNQRRLQRLEGLLREELIETSGGGEDEAADEQAQQAAEQRHAQAEALRQRALSALDALAGTMRGIGDDAAPSDPEAARREAGDALAALEELRRLFFTLVEYVQALHGDQAETHDRTATLQFESNAGAEDDFAAQVSAAASRQNQHGQLGDALAAALAQQADAASAEAAGAPPAAPTAPDAANEEAAAATAGAQMQETAERLAEAAKEVRQAAGRMAAAKATLDDAAVRAETMSPELEPALEDQLAALDHLQNALQALAPPPGQDDQADDGGQSGQQQATPQRDQSTEEERMSQRQALKRLQAIRDREAQRQRRRADATQPAPVEKDW